MQIFTLAEIRIPPDRQRGAPNPEAVADLADSIEKLGLINPITVDRNSEGTMDLLAGETRYRAMLLLSSQGICVKYSGTTLPLGSVPVNLYTDLSPLARAEIELEENIKRTELPWQRRELAIKRIFDLKLPQATTRQEAYREVIRTIDKVSAEAHVQAKDLSVTPAVVHQAVILSDHLTRPEVAKAKTRNEALKIVSRILRKEEDATRAQTIVGVPGIIQGDALSILASFPDGHFHAICSDPPYGIGITQMSYQSSSEQEYDDSYETWVPLMEGLCDQLRRVLTADASGYLFCDFSRFSDLEGMLRRSGFDVFPRPFIWDRSPDGRLTTPEKWPRRCYECIVYFRRGTRPLYEVRSDVLRFPADRDQLNYHGAKKPVELYVDLLQRIVRPGDRVVDPFAGSGPLLRAGRKLSLETVLIEKDPAYFGLIQKLAEEPAPAPLLADGPL